MFGFGNKDKVHKVTIANTGETFEVKGKINLLQAAQNAGIEWPCDCKVGSCGTCRAVLKEGKVKELADFAYTLDGDMLKEGYILACQSSLKTVLCFSLVESSKLEIYRTVLKTLIWALCIFHIQKLYHLLRPYLCALFSGQL